MYHDRDTLTLARLADALGDVRAEIRKLRAREADLRQAVIDANPPGPVAGQRYEVSVRDHARRVFDRDSLPGAILGDARFWMTRMTRTVVTRDRPAAACPGAVAVTTRPCDTDRGADRDLWGRETDLVLIEDF